MIISLFFYFFAILSLCVDQKWAVHVSQSKSIVQKAVINRIKDITQEARELEDYIHKGDQLSTSKHFKPSGVDRLSDELKNRDASLATRKNHNGNKNKLFEILYNESRSRLLMLQLLRTATIDQPTDIGQSTTKSPPASKQGRKGTSKGTSGSERAKPKKGLKCFTWYNQQDEGQVIKFCQKKAGSQLLFEHSSNNEDINKLPCIVRKHEATGQWFTTCSSQIIKSKHMGYYYPQLDCSQDETIVTCKVQDDSPCIKAYIEAAKKGTDQPQCVFTNDGTGSYYTTKQCSTAKKRCWCVDQKSGVEVKPFKRLPMLCSNPNDRSIAGTTICHGIMFCKKKRRGYKITKVCFKTRSCGNIG